VSLDSWDLNLDTTVQTQDLDDNQYRYSWDKTGALAGSIESNEAKLTYFVKWTEHQRFLDDLLGYATWDGSSATLNRVIPERHPKYDFFFASDYVVDPFGQPSQGSDGVTDWGLAQIETTFKANTYAVSEDHEITTELDRYVTYEYDASVDYLTIPGLMKFCTAIAGMRPVLNSTPGRRIPQTQITLTWLQVPADPTDPFRSPTDNAVGNCIGTLNNASFLGRPKGTLLFVKPNTRMAAPRLGVNANFYTWMVQYVLLYRNNGTTTFGENAGHNYIYNQAAGVFDLVTNTGISTGQRIYAYSDFNQLFDLRV
jgi:hypothetical protein